MKKHFSLLLMIILAITVQAQDTTKVKVSLKETQKWIKEKVQSNGGRQVPQTTYKVDFPDSCTMKISEINSVDNSTANVFTLNFSGIDFEKTSKKVNSVGTLILLFYGSVNLTNEYANVNKCIELRFSPSNADDFYNRLIKAMKNMKALCGGSIDDKF
jgi:citrate synthase